MRSRNKVVATFKISESGVSRVEWVALTGKQKHSGTIEGLIDYMERVRGGTDFYVYGLHLIATNIIAKLKGYEFEDDKKPSPGHFTFFAIEMGQWYSFSLTNKSHGVTHKFFDIFHILPIDKNKIRSSFANPEDDELEVMRKTVVYLKKSGMSDKLTIGSKALTTAKAMHPGFESYFPELDEKADRFCRVAYKGGYMFYREKFQFIGSGKCYDVNNMYPWILKNKPLPYGAPVWFEGEEAERIPEGTLYIAECVLDIKIKPGKLPILCKKDGCLGTEFVSDTRGARTYIITSVEVESIFERYEVFDFQIIRGFMFRKACGIFSDYVDLYYNMKVNAKTPAESLIAKLMNNNLVGKFGTKPWGTRLLYENGEYVKQRTEIKTVYVRLAAFLNAYGRVMISDYAQKCKKDSLFYIDTDSIFTSDEPDLPISGELGDFKIEKEFDSFAVNKMKQYAWHNSDGWNVVISGVPREVLAMTRNMDEDDEAFIKKFTLGFDIDSVADCMVDGIYRKNRTTFHIGKS